MWQTEHSTETSAAPETIWQLWSDVADWPRWNADLERAELAGPFAEGSRITMFPRDDDPIELTIVEADEPCAFVDQADLGPITVRTEHRVTPVWPNRSRIVYRMEITGPEADTLGPHIGPEITSDFPDVLAQLAAVAEDR